MFSPSFCVDYILPLLTCIMYNHTNHGSCNLYTGDLNKLQERWSLVKKVDTERPSTPMLNPPVEQTLMTAMQRKLSERSSMQNDNGRLIGMQQWPWSHPAWMHMSDPFEKRRSSVDSNYSTPSDYSDDLEQLMSPTERHSGFFISADGHCIVNGEAIEAWQLVPAGEP